MTGRWWWAAWAAVGLVLVVSAAMSGLARRGVWWRWTAVGLFVAAVAAVALAGPSDHYLYEVDRPSYPGYGRADPPEGTFVDLSAGAFRTCGVRTSGAIECWGDDYGDPPPGRFVKVDIWEYAYAGNACAVAIDTSVTCWTTYDTEVNLPAYSQDYGQADAPTEGFVDASVAGRFSCGLRPGGAIECWGDNIGDDYRPTGALEVPEGPFVQLQAGHPPCGLRPSGEFVCWSDRATRVVQQDHPFWRERLSQVSSGWGFVIWRGAGNSSEQPYVCGVRTDSTLVCSLGGTPRGEFLQVDHSAGPPCALRADRSIVCWNPHGSPAWDVLLDLPRGEFTDIAVGAYHACAIRVDGTVACWGDNSDRPRKPSGCEICPRLDVSEAGWIRPTPAGWPAADRMTPPPDSRSSP